MNYKFFNNFSSKYIVLSYFHRGIFWGTIFSWIAVLSAFSGAVITKVFYIDKRQIMVVKNYAVPPTSQSIVLPSSDSVEETEEFALTSIDWQNSSSNSRELTVSLTDSFLFSSNYRLASNTFLDFHLTPAKLSFDLDDSLTWSVNSTTEIDNSANLKNSKIIIQNTTSNPQLAKQVYYYLQERDFKNIAIAETKPFAIGQTTITTQSQNLAAANYLKTTLDLGILNLSDNDSFEGTAQSGLLIQLGEDAKFFSHAQNFIYYDE